MELELNPDAETPRCPTCGEPGLMSALVPYEMLNERGESVPGKAVAVLCATCDIDDGTAGPLIAFFTVHGQITDETLAQATPLITAWAETARPKPVDDDKLAADIDAWERDEL
jgi:uncharacterized protein DUF6300